MAAPASSLDELLGQLARERSLRGRLRVLGRSWKLVQSLAPRERESVALRVGSKWVWRRLEKSFLADGQLSESEEMVKRALERMGGADPDELRGLATTLRSGDKAELKDLMLITLEEALEAEASERAEDEAEIEAAPEPEPETPPLPVAPEPAVAVPASDPEPAPSPEPAPMPAPLPIPAPVSPRGLVVEPLPVPQPLPDPAPRSEREPDVRPDPEPVIEWAGFVPPDTGSVLSARDRLRLLRELRETPVTARALGEEGRRNLLARLSPGWAARRALSHMIRTRAFDDLSEALSSVGRLDTTTRQAWCLSELIEHWGLDDDERGRVLAAAPTDATRRRLERRRPRA